MSSTLPETIGIIGGCGHVGLPLALLLADLGHPTFIYDVNPSAVERVRRGEMPFEERDAQPLLADVLQRGLLTADTQPHRLAECDLLVLIIGTPVDEHLNPGFTDLHRALDQCLDHLRDGQVLILRSTVYPGITQQIQRYLHNRGKHIPVAFCPERVAQGHSLREFRELPQIISAFDRVTLATVRRLFERFGSEVVEMEPMEAELAKLMTNAWRYIQFATVNQFYVIASKAGLNFDRILHGCRYKYPRMEGMPGPGLAAGPCLVKDTMQLAAFSQNSFGLGHAAMLVNEGLPAHLIELARRQCDLRRVTTGILGMAFKAESDDARDSLSYKLRKLLTLESKRVLCTDPYVSDSRLVPLERVLAEAEVLFVATPHRVYRDLFIPADRVVIDVWNILGKTC